MKVIRRIPFQTRIGLVILLAVIAAYYVAGPLQASARISEPLKVVMSEGAKLVDLGIEVDNPTTFHLPRYRAFGALGGVDGDIIMLRRVPVASVGDIARDYWIRQVSLLGR